MCTPHDRNFDMPLPLDPLKMRDALSWPTDGLRINQASSQSTDATLRFDVGQPLGPGN